MTRLRSIIFILLLLVSPLILCAQTKAAPYAKISSTIAHNYRPDSVALSRFCRIGCIFIKFNVDQKGDIANLSFSGDLDSTKFITDALTITLDFLKQDASLINSLKKSGRTIIQPFIYNYEAGCNFQENATKNISDYYLSYLSIMSDMDHALLSLFKIVKFNNKDAPYVDGILLPPIGVSNVVMH